MAELKLNGSAINISELTWGERNACLKETQSDVWAVPDDVGQKITAIEKICRWALKRKGMNDEQIDGLPQSALLDVWFALQGTKQDRPTTGST